MIHATRAFVLLLVVVPSVLAQVPGTPGAPGVPGVVQKQPADGRFVKIERRRRVYYMVPYSETIPGSTVTFEMVPITGGVFTMGSPPDEPGRNESEGPQVQVAVEPFWMGKYEVTWGEYQEFMKLYEIFRSIRTRNDVEEKGKKWLVMKDNRADAVTIPSPLYALSIVAPMGIKPRYPAVTMTQYAARQYTKWLSKLTGEFYRLPTEAEWEHACRAGTTMAFSFGDDPSQIGDYAWYWENSLDKALGTEAYHAVGLKKPNPWGLYDMHGNVKEWVIDQLEPGWYAKFAGEMTRGHPHIPASHMIRWPTEVSGRVLRGGSWYDDPQDCRSASRFAHDHDYLQFLEPNRPKSPAWFSSEEAMTIGFRIVRPLSEPDWESQWRFWGEETARLRDDARTSIDTGHSVEGIIDPDLPKMIEDLEPAP